MICDQVLKFQFSTRIMPGSFLFEPFSNSTTVLTSLRVYLIDFLLWHFTYLIFPFAIRES